MFSLVPFFEGGRFFATGGLARIMHHASRFCPPGRRTGTSAILANASSSGLTREPIMHTFIIATTAAAALFSSGAFAQEPRKDTASIPDFSGVWSHPYLPGYEPPASGPGPVKNRSRVQAGPQRGVSSIDQLVGDYTNPILKPNAAEVVKRLGENELRGIGLQNPINQCWPEPVPLILLEMGMLMFQQPGKITILYSRDHQIRHVRMNQPHPQRVTPSWSGDSVGHYEGDTLVIDTVGIKVGPFAAVD
jgi:hypothetical protein